MVRPYDGDFHDDDAMTNEDIRARYPRLIEAMLWTACLSVGEAVACIRDYRSGLPYSGEAVNHFGGTKLVLGAASRALVRHFMLDHRIERRHQLNQTGRP